MWNRVLQLVWAGIWTGFGVEGSFFVLWVVWKIAHSRIAHRVEDTHWWHVFSEYFK